MRKAIFQLFRNFQCDLRIFVFSEIFVRPTLFVRHGRLVSQMSLLLLSPWVFGKKYCFLTISIDAA